MQNAILIRLTMKDIAVLSHMDICMLNEIAYEFYDIEQNSVTEHRIENLYIVS